MMLSVILALASCKVDEGTEPGNDSNPSVSVYQYKVSAPFNEDNDVKIRFATNDVVVEAYYFSEKTSDMEARYNSVGEDGYMDYVIENGTKIDGISGASNVDVTLTGLIGEYTITAVAVSKSSRSMSQTVFTGLEWEDVVQGTYQFGTEDIGSGPMAAKDIIGMNAVQTTLQVCTTNDMLYRFKDIYGTGKHLKINLIDYFNSDESGEYQYFRVPLTETPYTFGNYGAISVSDIGYWQGDESFVTQRGYESGIYEDNNCFICVAYTVSAGYLCYGYDYFVPDN